eukprot:gb/GECH01013644.1/.p1 GENE.gb/GECH01013644.1/~~gb/GECH01013644.1/.p1  ORF type:complete len:133 (+),score=21.06 gb/GECH01013644.1/:1-399(+)
MTSIDSSQRQEVILTQHKSIWLNGVQTEIICSSFADKVTIFITQTGNPGTLVLGQQEGTLTTGQVSYEIHTLSGKREEGEMEHVVAWQILDSMRIAGCGKSLLLGLGLPSNTKLDKTLVQNLLQLVETARVW